MRPAAIAGSRMERRLAQQRFDSMTRMGKAGNLAMDVYMGNILSGLPTHAIALMSDFFNGTGNVLSRLLAAKRRHPLLVGGARSGKAFVSFVASWRAA